MIAYPGYTIARIEEELTPAMADELLTACSKQPPAALQLAKLNAVICGILGIKDTPQAVGAPDIATQLRSAGVFKVEPL